MKAFRFKVIFGHLGFVCFVLYKTTISGERLQDHWSSGSEIIAASDLNGSRSRHLIEYMKIIFFF